MSFDEALENCCCCCDEQEEPDLYRYFAAPMVDERFNTLVATVDFGVEKTKTGMKVTSVSSPLIYEPRFMGKLSCQDEMPPLRQSQQIADLGKRSESTKQEDHPAHSKNRGFDSLKPQNHKPHDEPSQDKTAKEPRKR